MSDKPILYFDMDGVLVDFQSGIARLPESDQPAAEAMMTLPDDDPRKKTIRPSEVEGIFTLMDPMPGAIEAVEALRDKFDIYILSTCPWNNVSAASEKIAWVKKHFGDGEDSPFYQRIVLSHHKNLNRGAYLIDDRTLHGAGEFDGELIQFGTEKFPDWRVVVDYLLAK